MSLNRIALRLAVVEAAANFFRAPWPTFAGKHVYDSKIEPSEEMDSGTAIPMVVVYTDYDKDLFLFRNNAQAPRMLNLTLELLMVQKAETIKGEGEDEDTYTIGTPTTDAELEVSLDMMELQIYRTLRESEGSAAECFRFLCQRVDNVVSRRGASVENGQRVAARQITMEMDLLRDPDPGILPPTIAAFLEDIQNFDEGTSLQASELRAEYLRPGLIGFETPIARGMDLTQGGGAALGMPARGAPLLPPTVEWLDPHGRPLR